MEILAVITWTLILVVQFQIAIVKKKKKIHVLVVLSW